MAIEGHGLRIPPIQMSRSSSSGSAVSHMDLQIKHHWNDAVAPSLLSRSVSPLAPVVTIEKLQERIEHIISSDSKLSPQQKKAHIERLDALDIVILPQDQKVDLYMALNESTPTDRRKGMVEFIRRYDGVIRWAASLRSLTESML